MVERPQRTSGSSVSPAQGGGNTSDGLRMAPETMLDLARRAAEILVERIDGLPGQEAWDGDFRDVLDDQLLEDPPEDGRPGVEVLERAAREILPLAMRLDHP